MMTPDRKNGTFNLFVYGTLTDPSVFRAVMGVEVVARRDLADGTHSFYATQAILNGYKKISPDNTYLYAVPDRGHRIRGYLIHDLPRDALPALNRYEGQNYSRRKLRVQTNEGETRAVTFVGNQRRLEHSFGYHFRDPLKQEILLRKKIDNVIRETEKEKLHTDEEKTRQAVEELSGRTIRDIIRQHFEAGGISDYSIRHFLKDRPLADTRRIREDPKACALSPNYLRMVLRQVIFNRFEERIHRDYRYELDHLPQAGTYYSRIISSLVALRMVNRSQTVMDVVVADLLAELDFQATPLIEYIRRGIEASEALYRPELGHSQLEFVRGHMGFGHIPLGAELEFSNIGHEVIRDRRGQRICDRMYDGFLYFDDFGLDVLTWKLGGHIDDHRIKIPGEARRGFFEVALGNLSIEANLSMPITRDPWVLNQLIHQTRRFYEVAPHSVHLSMQPKTQHRPDRDRMLPMGILQCLFAIGGDPGPTGSLPFAIRRLARGEIVREDEKPNLMFCDISRRQSSGVQAYLPAGGVERGLFVQQYRFMRLSPDINYEPVIMALKGLQISHRPGTFLTPMQWERSKAHREMFSNIMSWGREPETIQPRDIHRFLLAIEEGLMKERQGEPVHSRAYISWCLSQVEEMLEDFNTHLSEARKTCST